MALADEPALAYDLHGRGRPTLVFVHGWACDRSYWTAQVEEFGRDFQVLTVDLAGHGASAIGRKGCTIENLGAGLAAVVERLALDGVILIGHSMGGKVILEAARRLPGRVAGLVWIDTYAQLTTFRTAAEVHEWLAPFRANFAEATQVYVRAMFPDSADAFLVERVAANMSAAAPEVAIEALESALNYGPETAAVLQELALPVTAINAEWSRSNVDSLASHGVNVVVMPGVGHFLILEEPQRFNRLLRSAIEGFGRQA